MIKKYPYLNDNQFLKFVDELHLKTQYAKIILLNWKEQPIKEIQGVVTGGNMNLDGKSSMRRTCNLSTFIADTAYHITDIDNPFSLNKKIQIEIGYKNTTPYYQEYEMLWYPQGTFIITNTSLNRTAGGVIVSLTCKDKMCLLNGEVGGTFPASVTFHEYDTIDANGARLITRPVIVQIIRELVHHWRR